MDAQSVIVVVIMFSCLTIMIILSLWSSRTLRRLKKKILEVEARLEAKQSDG